MPVTVVFRNLLMAKSSLILDFYTFFSSLFLAKALILESSQVLTVKMDLNSLLVPMLAS